MRQQHTPAHGTAEQPVVYVELCYTVFKYSWIGDNQIFTSLSQSASFFVHA